jgi:hypothetical protein
LVDISPPALPADKSYLGAQGLGVPLAVGGWAAEPPYVAPPVALPVISCGALSWGVVLAFLLPHATIAAEARSTPTNIFFIDSLR